MVALVVSNLLYPLIAVVVAALLCVGVVLQHRRPKSVEANMEAFNKGLRALAPDSDGGKGSSTRPAPRRGAPSTVARQPSVPLAPSVPEYPDADSVDGVEAETG
jgi:hypothetical protein